MRKIRTTAPITDKTAIRKLMMVPGSTGLFIHFGLFTALRISEILSLKWSDVVQDGKVKPHTRIWVSKQKKYRDIAFSEPLQKSLVDLFFRTNPNMTDYIFTSESNRSKGNVPITKEAMTARIKPILESVGAQHPTSHTLRKTMARQFYERNGIAATMQLLGHSKEEMTLIYVGISSEEMRGYLKRFSYED